MNDIATKLAEIKQLRNNIRSAIENKDVDLPIGSPMVNYPAAIEDIQTKMSITVLDNTNVNPESGMSARIDPDLEGLAIITPEIDNFAYLFKESKIQSVVNLAVGVTDMSDMFYDSQATKLDLSSFDTSNVTSMRYMFSYSQATMLDLSSFDTSSVTNMGFMFFYSKATKADLSSFDTSNVTNMGSMFRYSQIRTVYVRNQAEKDRFESKTTANPSGLSFVVKGGD